MVYSDYRMSETIPMKVPTTTDYDSYDTDDVDMRNFP